MLGACPRATAPERSHPPPGLRRTWGWEPSPYRGCPRCAKSRARRCRCYTSVGVVAAVGGADADRARCAVATPGRGGPRRRSPAAPHRGAVPSSLAAAGLDQQVPVRAQPGRRAGDHPALHVEAVRAAVEGDPAPRGRGPRAASSRSPRSARTARWPPPRAPGRAASARQRVVQVALEHPLRRQVAPGAGDRGRVDVDGVHVQAGHGREQRGRDRAGAAARGRRPRHPGPTSASATRTSSSVRRRGTNTVGATASRSPQNSAQPDAPARAARRALARRPAARGGRVARPPRRAGRPPPRRTRSRLRAAAPRARRGGGGGHRDDGSMPGPLDQISYVVVGYAGLVAARRGYAALRWRRAAAVAGLDGLDARGPARRPGPGRARRAGRR